MSKIPAEPTGGHFGSGVAVRAGSVAEQGSTSKGEGGSFFDFISTFFILYVEN